MKITVKVHARARRNRLSCEGDGYKLEATAPPVEGQANEAVIEIQGATEDRISSLL